MNTPASNTGFISYSRADLSETELMESSVHHFQLMNERRSCRHFSSKPVSREVIENLIKTASTAPSGANKQPWHFVAVSDPQVKQQIRQAAEEEEKEFYQERAPQEWLDDLKALGTDWKKPFLETAPWLIVIFRKTYEPTENGKSKNYYVQESVGIACGLLISAIHQIGLASLTHTPSPMNFLSEILNRPQHEKPFLLLPVGYPSKEAKVPDIRRKELSEVCSFV